MAANRPQNSPAPAAPQKARDLLSPKAAAVAAVLLAVVVFAIYSPSLNFQFILDDHRFTSDPRLQNSGHLWEYFTSFAWAQFTGGPLSFFRPIFVCWLRLNFLFVGVSPWGWHFLSIAKHLAVALLLGLLVWKLLRNRTAALLAASLFALHPAQTESVSWVTVPDPLMAIAALAAILFYLKHAEQFSPEPASLTGKLARKARKQEGAKPRRTVSPVWLIASAAAFLVALFAKETGVVLLVIFFALALLRAPAATPNGEVRGSPQTASSPARLRFAARELLPFLAAFVAYFLLRWHALGGHLAPATQHLPPQTVLLSLPATLSFYVQVLFWPVHWRAYADPLLQNSFSAGGVVLPALAVIVVVGMLAAVCVAAWKIARRASDPREASGVTRAILLGTLVLALPILPALNLNALNPGDFLHGRYTYLPLVGLMLLVAVAYHLAGKARAVFLALAAVVAIAFVVLTVQQERPWKDDLTLFTYAHEVAPHDPVVDQSFVRARVQAALSLSESGQCDQAMQVFNDAIRQYPNDWYAWAGLGECYAEQQHLPQAEQALHRAADLAHQPRVTEAWQQIRQQMGLPASAQ